jgi:GNAT superfamily N-acetyltransferase
VSLLVRNLAAQDLDDVLVLAAESLEAPHWNRRDYERILLAEPSDPLLRCGLVADSGGKVAGFAVASWLRQEAAAEVEGLFVELDYRRQGLEYRRTRSLSPARLFARRGPACLLLVPDGRCAGTAGAIASPDRCTSIILQGFDRKHGS